MKDILDNPISVGDVIAIATQSYGELKVGVVIDLVNKPRYYGSEDLIPMVRVITVGSTRWGDTYGSHLVVIDTPNEDDDSFYNHLSDENEKFNKAFAYFNLYQAKKAYKEA